MDRRNPQPGKGLYRSKCVSSSCGHVATNFAPVVECEQCGGPVTQVEFRPLGTEGEDETIKDMHATMLEDIDRFFMESA